METLNKKYYRIAEVARNPEGTTRRYEVVARLRSIRSRLLLLHDALAARTRKASL